jgi:translocation and assembly module TamB
VKKRAGRYILIGCGLLAAAVFTASVLYLRSARFQEQARSAITARIEQSTGLRLSMSRFSLDVLRGTFSITRPDLKSRKSFAFSADEISGSFRLTTLWRPKFELSELYLLRPHISIRPQPGGKPFSIEPVMRRAIQVAARKATIRNGWVEYDNRRIALDLVLEGLECDIQYRPSPQSYAVRLAYRNSTLLWAGRKFVYDLDARLNVLPGGLEIAEFKLRENKSRFSGRGSLSPWTSPALKIRAAGDLAGEDAVLITPDLKEARGTVTTVLDLFADARNYHLWGKFQSDSVRYRTSEARSLTGLFDVQKDVFSLTDVRGKVGDGDFQLAGELQLKPHGRAANHLKISAQKVAIRDGDGIINLHRLALENQVDADVVLEWHAGAQDLSVEGAVTLYGIPDAAPGSETRTALQGTTEFFYRKDAWYVKKASLTSPGTDIDITGLDSERARVRVSTNRPAEIFRMVRGFSNSLEDLFTASPDWMAITGSYRLDGEFQIRHPETFSYRGQASVVNGQWRRYRLDSLSGTASWDGSRLQLQGMRARKKEQEARGEFRLDWAKGDTGPDFYFNGTVDRISLASLADFGIDLKGQTAGILAGRGQVTYESGIFHGGGHITVDKGNLSGQPFDTLVMDVQVADQEIDFKNGRIQRGAAAVGVDGRVNLETRAMKLAARLTDLPLADLPEVKENALAVDGRVTASGQIEGTLDNPEIKNGRIEVEGLRYAGWDLGRGSADIELRDKLVSVNRIDVRSDLGKFSGNVLLSTDPGYPGKASLKFSDWNIKKVVADSASRLKLLGDLDTALLGSLTIEGPFAEYAKLKYQGDLDGARFTINGFKIQNDGPMSFRGDAENVVIEQARLVGEGTRLTLEKGGTIPFEPDKPALNLRVNGRLNLKVMDRLSGKTGVSGFADLRDVNVTGSWRAPEVIGRATVENTRVDFEDLPYPFTGLGGNIIFSRKLVRLDNIRGAVAAGTIQVNGTVDLQNADVPVINLQGALRKVRLRYPKDFVSKVDADLTLSGSPGSYVLGGDVTVLRAEYLRDFNLLEQLVGGSSGSSGPQVTDSAFASTRLKDISVHSQNGLFIENELMRVQGGMSLMLHGTFSNASVTGRVWANEGLFFFRGNRLEIINGTIDFVDRNRINPVLNVRMEADVRSYRVRMDVNGDLAHLHSHGFTISSDPPLSQVDILSLLITGKSEDPTGMRIAATEDPRRQAAMTGLSAASILSEEMTGVVGKRVERIFGLSTFRVDPFLAGAENDPTARVTISQRMSKDLAITFSRNLSTNQEQIVVLEYDVNKNLTIIATRDEDGKFGIDFKFRKRLR